MSKCVLLGCILLSALTSSSLAAAEQAKIVEQYGQSTTPVVSRIFGQVVISSLPPDFKVAFENSGPNTYVREAVLKNESLSAWSQMITVTGARRAALNDKVTPLTFAGALAKGYTKACPNSFGGQIVGPRNVSGHQALLLFLSCGTSPSTKGKTSEAALIAVIKGAEDYYTIQWAERGPPSATPITFVPSHWEPRLAKLNPIRVCSPVRGEKAPYLSCFGAIGTR